jgi:hypothetical protein
LLASVALALALLAVALGRPQWLVPGVASLLPAGWQLDEVGVVAQAPRLPRLQRLALVVRGCRLLEVEDARATLGWRGLAPALAAVEAAKLRIDPACLPDGSSSGPAPVDPPGWAAGLLAGAEVRIDELVVAGWLPEPHRLALRASTDGLAAEVDGPLVRVASRWHRGEGIAITGLDTAGVSLAPRVLAVANPRVELLGPAHLDPATRRLRARLRLSADRLNLTDGGKLDGPAVELSLDGPVDDLHWTAEGNAGGIGPVQAQGTWAAGVLSARLSLARQALSALRSLLPPTVPIELEAGEVGIAATVTWMRDAPAAIVLEGELAVSGGRLVLTHAVAEGVSVRLPFGFADGVWRLGGKRAGEIGVGRIVAAVEATAASARIAGTWPVSERSPLRIEGLRAAVLGGEATVDRLVLPPRGSRATLKLRGIRLEEVSALYGDATVGLRGSVDADLPLHLGDAPLLVEDGQVRNASALHVRVTDAEALEAFKSGNPTLAQAADWLADLEVDHLEGTVNLARDGALVLATTIEGRNPTLGGRAVRLNYRHEENLLHLLQSLRIGSDLSRGIEQRLSPKSRRR